MTSLPASCPRETLEFLCPSGRHGAAATPGLMQEGRKEGERQVV